MGLLNDIARFAGQVEDKTIGSGVRAANMLGTGLRNIPTRVTEALNPNDAESRGDTLAQQASIHYGFTPSFQKQIHNANPVYSQAPIATGNTNLKDGGQAIGLRYGDNRLHRIAIGQQPIAEEDNTVLHEGLHDAYSNLKPDTKVLYDSLVNQAMNQTKDVLGPKVQTGPNSYSQKVIQPGLRLWLQNRTDGYTSNKGQTFNDIGRLDPSLQDEVHSYIPEYYQTTKQPMPQGLKDYYANYYSTGGTPTHISKYNTLQLLARRIFGN